ncbi:Universal stress protein [uncultured archaeon]|nr:Universal stress protein [uncultured archaeon]
MFQKILIATDGSENSKRAAKAGIEIAKNFGGKVTALFVADPRRYFMGEVSYNIADEVMEGIKNEVMREGEAAMRQVEEDAKIAAVSLEKKIVEGHPAEEIIKMGSDMDLIVVGRIGLTGMPKFLVGSAADKIIRNSKVPVLIIS